jgi:hypothetical protein
VIIECPNCESKVDAKVLATHEYFDEYEGPIKVTLLECPVCKDSMLACQDTLQTGPNDWSEPVRVWPQPEKYVSSYLPNVVRNALLEAEKCFKGKAYSACAVMCGVVLEAICSEYKIKNKLLRGGLKELLDKQIIDKRIYEWGEALRKHRNIGAHATEEKISKDAAKYLLDFAEAICEYIFVLTKKFETFMKTKEKSEKKGNLRNGRGEMND